MSRRRQFERGVEVDVEQVAHDVAVAGGPCPGRCNAGWRWAVQVQESGLTDESAARALEQGPRLGVPVWCRQCQVKILDALGRLPEVVAVLASMPGGRLAATGRTDVPVRSTAIVSPSGSPAWDAADEVISWAWATSVALLQRLGLEVPPEWWTRSAAPVVSLTTSVGVLTQHAEAWLSGPDAEQDGATCLRLERSGQRITGRDELVHRLPVPCPECDTLTLCREDGDDHAWCYRCQRVWTDEDYRALVGDLLEREVGA